MIENKRIEHIVKRALSETREKNQMVVEDNLKK